MGAICCNFFVSAWAQEPVPEASLTLPKTSGGLRFGVSYAYSTDFYDGNGNRKDSSDPSFPDGSPEHYHDLVLSLGFEYGLLDSLGFWIDAPLVYRTETASLNASDFGIGDVGVGTRFRFWRTDNEAAEFATELSSRFPTGNTDIAFNDPSTGRSARLTTGRGSRNIALSLLAKEHLLQRRFSLEETFAYRFLLKSTVEYLRTTSILQTAPDGSIVSLPVGNLKIDWGDEITAGGTARWRFFEHYVISLGGEYFYRFSTNIDAFTFSSTGSTLKITPVTQTASSAYVLSILPSFSWEPAEDLRIRATVSIPLAGASYPTLPFVESLVGNRYQLEIRYAF